MQNNTLADEQKNSKQPSFSTHQILLVLAVMQLNVVCVLYVILMWILALRK